MLLDLKVAGPGRYQYYLTKQLNTAHVHTIPAWSFCLDVP
jgi:hypothetical protein